LYLSISDFKTFSELLEESFIEYLLAYRLVIALITMVITEKKRNPKNYLVFIGFHQFPKMCFFSFLQTNKDILTDKETVSMAIQLLLE